MKLTGNSSWGTFREDLAAARFWIGTFKDVIWLVTGFLLVASVIFAVLSENVGDIAEYALAVVLPITVYLLVRSYAYRAKNKRLYAAFRHFNNCAREISKQLGIELRSIEESIDLHLENSIEISFEQEQAFVLAQGEALRNILRKILDSAQNTFSELSKKECTVVLLQPDVDSKHGDHFRSKMYSSNVSRDRFSTTKPHSSRLFERAWVSDQPILLRDLKKELDKGDFVKSRDDEDPFKYYRSAMLCRFFVKGVPYGIISIDSKSSNALIEDYKVLFQAFAEMCGITFSLVEHGDLGNESH